MRTVVVKKVEQPKNEVGDALLVVSCLEDEASICGFTMLVTDAERIRDVMLLWLVGAKYTVMRDYVEAFTPRYVRKPPVAHCRFVDDI